MNILLLSTNDILGGAAMVTFRLMQALRHEGADARMLVANRQSDSPCVARVGQARLKAAFVAERAGIFLQNGLNLGDLWKVSTARFGAAICSHPWVRRADVIVINWVCQGFLSLGELERLGRMGKPLVWIMHDLWCATGICHIPGECTRYADGCGHCPLLHWEKGARDLSARVWKRKKEVFDSLHARFIAVSQWQRRCAELSPLLSRHSIDVIPHAFPAEDYRIAPDPAFRHEALDFLRTTRRKIITMGAARLDDPVKDLPMAIKSLNILADKFSEEAAECEAVFFGNIRRPEAFDKLKTPWRHVGTLDAAALRQLYAASSVVLSTSLFETMGATLMEGMAAGATPVTFGRGGQPDIVTHGVNGYIAEYGSPESVASCIARALRSPFPREAQHSSVADRFSDSVIARRYLSLFSRLTLRRGE